MTLRRRTALGTRKARTQEALVAALRVRPRTTHGAAQCGPGGLPKRATYVTLLMSTGLTFGTIASLYGLQAGYIDKTQFTILVTVVIATAVIPTVIAQRFFQPPLPSPSAVPGSVDEAEPAGAAEAAVQRAEE